MFRIGPIYRNEYARAFCDQFIYSQRPKYVFGRNEYAESIAGFVEVDGFIDDFSQEKYYLNRPIVDINDVPDDALVVVVVVGKPLTAEKRVRQFQFESLDYYSFCQYSGLNLRPVIFQDGFTEDVILNIEKYSKIYDLLEDRISKNQFFNVINFRFSSNLNFMRGFTPREDVQYFEEFLDLRPKGECFVDIGGFDGYTSQEFIKKCLDYDSIHFFEPDPENMLTAKRKLATFERIHYYPIGLSDEKQTLRFDSRGSCSRLSEAGEHTVKVGRLDDLLSGIPVSLIKMDIEGAEPAALEGARKLIASRHPRLAVSVYHRPDDMWRIPELVLSIRPDYKIYLRHYTEGIAETVMFFIPRHHRKLARLSVTA